MKIIELTKTDNFKVYIDVKSIAAFYVSNQEGIRYQCTHLFIKGCGDVIKVREIPTAIIELITKIK